MHTSEVPIILYKVYSHKHSEPISLENYARIVDFTLSLRVTNTKIKAWKARVNWFYSTILN
jgi:hypothetical protein